jgi:hypothetical protein
VFAEETIDYIQGKRYIENAHRDGKIDRKDISWGWMLRRVRKCNREAYFES